MTKQGEEDEEQKQEQHEEEQEEIIIFTMEYILYHKVFKITGINSHIFSQHWDKLY